jgi:hypothetical protein
VGKGSDLRGHVVSKGENASRCYRGRTGFPARPYDFIVKLKTLERWQKVD